MENPTGPAALLSTVSGMRINSEEIIALGESIAGIADQLQQEAAETRGAGGPYGFVDGTAKGALDSVRGDYELVRIALCEQLHGLATLARQAGGCYVAAEDRVQGSFRVGP